MHTEGEMIICRELTFGHILHGCLYTVGKVPIQVSDRFVQRKLVWVVFLFVQRCCLPAVKVTVQDGIAFLS